MDVCKKHTERSTEMDLFTTTAEILVLSLISSAFIAMAASSILDSIADQRVLATRTIPNFIAH